MFTKKSYLLQKYSSTFFTGIWRTLTVFQSNWKNIPTPLERWLNMELTDLIKFTKSTRSRSWLNLRKNEVGFYNSVFSTFFHFNAYKIDVSFCCYTWSFRPTGRMKIAIFVIWYNAEISGFFCHLHRFYVKSILENVKVPNLLFL